MRRTLDPYDSSVNILSLCHYVTMSFCRYVIVPLSLIVVNNHKINLSDDYITCRPPCRKAKQGQLFITTQNHCELNGLIEGVAYRRIHVLNDANLLITISPKGSISQSLLCLNYCCHKTTKRENRKKCQKKT